MNAVGARVRGGFKSRWRVAYVLDLIAALRDHLSYHRFEATWSDVAEVRERRARMDSCPHLSHWHIEPLPGWIDCSACGRCLRNPKGWLV